MSEVLDSNFNGYPKVTDWDKVYFLLQQANSKGFNAATKAEIVKELFGDVAIQGADYEDLPVAESTDPVPLPIPDTQLKYGFLSNGKYSQPNGPTLEYTPTQWGLTLFDGEKWVKKFTLEIPEPTGVDQVTEDGTGVPMEKAVYRTFKVVDKKIESIIEPVKIGEIVHKYVDPSATTYGSLIYGWGWPSKPEQKITAINIRLGAEFAVTTQGLVIKKNNESGAILFYGVFNKNIIGGDNIYRFDLPEVIENPDGDKLWIEIYGDKKLSVFRISPAVVFTQAAGYPFPRFTVNNDMGASGFTGGSSLAFYDIYHEVITVEEGYSFNELASHKIIELANENILLPKPVTETIERVDNHLKNESIPADGTYSPFIDGLGPQGNNNYKLGFPIGVIPMFDEFTLPVYFSSGFIRPTQFTLNIRRTNKDGEILATGSALFPSTGNGRLDTMFKLSKRVDSTERLYAELIANGHFGMYRRYPNPASIFIQANGYPPMATAITEGDPLVNTGYYFDFWFKTNTFKNITVLKDVFIDNLSEDSVNSTLPNENLRFSFTGSSVTWGDGFLQSGYVAEYIKWIQTKVAKTITASEIPIGTKLTNRQYFLGQALRLDGVGQSIEFEITGNEVSIIQAIERSNVAASEIEIYIDGILHDTINNFNPEPIGHETKSLTGTGTDVKFDLQRAFTYNHTLTVNGQPKVVVMNMNTSTGFTIPANADAAIVRMNGKDSAGNRIVTHCLWFKVAPALGDNISIGFDYAKHLFYEKTTIGQDANGINECPYGDGSVVFDPTSGPTSIGSGLDFRQTDDRVVKTYRFLEEKTRKVKLVVKGNYNGSTGTPYFIFNFATNRYFHFQNAGIGGWDLWDLDVSFNTDPFRNWQRVIEFNPDRLVIETTPNDDWIVKGHKLFRTTNVNLATLRGVKNLPLRSITYQSGTDSYDLAIWRGKIKAITNVSVSFEGTLTSSVVAGDIAMIGQYWANNYDYIERIVSSVDGDTIYFDKPISESEIIYNSLQDFVGKEISIRDYSTFKTKLSGIIDKIRNTTDCPIYLLENPMPNVLARELWGYPIVMHQISNSKQNVYSINYSSLRKWQNSQPKTSIVVNTNAAEFDPYLGKRVVEFGNNGQNILSVDILLNGLSVYGKKAVVQNGWAYTVNQSLTGENLNKTFGEATNAKQVFNGRKPKLILLDDTLSGNVTVLYSNNLWSADSCHMNLNSAKLYADFLKVLI